MRHYIIDGNNVIGKNSVLKKLQLKDRQSSREKLALIIERNFSRKNVKISLHFDGHPNTGIKIQKGKIIYSGNLTADEMIKKEIESSRNPRILSLVTSDLNLSDFARKCSCKIIPSEEFIKRITSSSSAEEENRRIQELNNPEEFKKLFGVK
jgi:predicted RNA-binding protein with PIN domain